MSTPALSVWIEDRRLSPVEAELRVQVGPLTHPAMEVRGRLAGPRSPYASTVEVSYPLRIDPLDALRQLAVLRVVIPEPNYWHPASPFLYHGTIELWLQGRCQDKLTFTHGLCKRKLDTAGLRLNGQALTIRGTSIGSSSETELRQLRQAGVNTLVAPSTQHDVWNVADRLGFLMIDRLTADTLPPERSSLPDRTEYGQNVSAFATLIAEDVAAAIPADEMLAWLARRVTPASAFLGLEVRQVVVPPLPPWANFIACTPELLPSLGWVPLPKLLVQAEGTATSEGPAVPGMLGWAHVPG